MTEDELRRAYAPIAGNVPADRSACPTPEVLQATIAHADTASDRLAVLRHVSECAACQSDIALLRTLHRAAAERRVRRWSGPIGLAAAAMIAAVLLIGRARPREEVRGEAGGLVAIGPAGDVPAAQPLTFVWHALANAKDYRVEVLDDSARVAFTAATSDTTLVAPSGVLAPGARYYWVVRAGARRSAPLVIRVTMR